MRPSRDIVAIHVNLAAIGPAPPAIVNVWLTRCWQARDKCGQDGFAGLGEIDEAWSLRLRVSAARSSAHLRDMNKDDEWPVRRRHHFDRAPVAIVTDIAPGIAGERGFGMRARGG